MDKDTANNVKSIVENSFKDALTQIIRSSAKEAIAQAVHIELENFIDQFKENKIEGDKAQIVRNGYHPERSISTGVG